MSRVWKMLWCGGLLDGCVDNGLSLTDVPSLNCTPGCLDDESRSTGLVRHVLGASQHNARERNNPALALQNGHKGLRRLSNQPVAEIVQCGERVPLRGRIRGRP
jgi:hypothetical protein